MPEHHSSHADTSGIGERLRNAREAKGLTLAAAETLTRIRAVYLEALENERFDHLPPAVYARGYLRTYALTLGLDPDELVEAYPGDFNAPQGPLFASLPTKIPIHPAAPPAPLRRVVAYAGVVILVIIAVLGLIGYLQLRQFAQPVSAPTPPAASAPAYPPAQVESAPAPPAPVPPAPPAAPARIPGGGVELMVQANGASWLRVLADDQEVFAGLLEAGDVKVWRARTHVTVRVGNKDVVSVLVNGQRIRPVAPGPVWEDTFTAP